MSHSLCMFVYFVIVCVSFFLPLLTLPHARTTSMVKRSGKLFTTSLVATWYCSNIGVLLLNKYLLSNYGFRYPIFLTMCHMIACSLLSYIAIAWLKVVPMQFIRSRVQFWKISALSIIFCASVVSGNISLRFLPVSFTQAVGATTPFFTAIFAYLATFKREAWLTYATLIPVVTGVVIASGVSLILILILPLFRQSSFVYKKKYFRCCFCCCITVCLLWPVLLGIKRNKRFFFFALVKNR